MTKGTSHRPRIRPLFGVGSASRYLNAAVSGWERLFEHSTPFGIEIRGSSYVIPCLLTQKECEYVDNMAYLAGRYAFGDPIEDDRCGLHVEERRGLGIATITV